MTTTTTQEIEAWWRRGIRQTLYLEAQKLQLTQGRQSENKRLFRTFGVLVEFHANPTRWSPPLPSRQFFPLEVMTQSPPPSKGAAAGPSRGQFSHAEFRWSTSQSVVRSEEESK